MTDAANEARMAPKTRLPGRYRAVVMGTIIFLCGALSGGGMTAIIGGRLVLDRIQNPHHLVDRIVGRLAWRLDLSDEQEARVRDIVSAHQQEFRALVAEIRPRFDATLETLRRDIAAQLDEEQVEEFNQHFDRIRALLTPRVPAPDGTADGAQNAPPSAISSDEG